MCYFSGLLFSRFFFFVLCRDYGFFWVASFVVLCFNFRLSSEFYRTQNKNSIANFKADLPASAAQSDSRLTGDQEAVGSSPAGNILQRILIMKYVFTVILSLPLIQEGQF